MEYHVTFNKAFQLLICQVHEFTNYKDILLN